MSEVNRIIEVARDNNIALLDTAAGYGDAEKVLGTLGAAKQFNIVSKVSPDTPLNAFVKHTLSSLNNLKAQGIYGLLLHHGSQLLSTESKEIHQQLQQLKHKEKFCSKIGCSVYSPQEALAISQNYQLDIVQIPASIFDQRILAPGILEQLKANELEIHIRSLFLQGAIFLPPSSLPPHLSELKSRLEKLRALAKEHGVSILSLALAPYVQNSLIDQLVLGCCSAKELQQIIRAYKEAETLSFDFQQLAIANEEVINPSKWKV